ncbi:MAG: flavin reductase family protein [Chloroflexi bacterium]|nr:flavin reductase family protein [Chloroflexota bacterium]
MTVFDGNQLRLTLRRWPSGVTVVTAQRENMPSPVGVTVSSFTSVSLEPPLILVCLFKETDVAQAILSARAFGVMLLGDDQADLSVRFAGFDPDFPDGADRFENLQTYHLVTGAPLFEHAIAALDCRVWAIHDGSTHYIIVGQVVAARTPSVDDDRQTLVYYNRGYHELTSLDTAGRTSR